MTFNDILNLYAKYNKHANSEMVRILGTLPEPRLHEAAGTYYKSMAGLLNHGLQSTAGSLKRIADRGFLSELILPAVDSFPQAPMGEPIFASFPEFVALRTRQTIPSSRSAPRPLPMTWKKPSVSWAETSRKGQ